jgi:hypothetical protein
MHGLYQWEAQLKISPEENAGAIERMIDRIFEQI